LRRLSIQFRLALWYCLSLAVIVALFAGGSWLALRASMYHSIDRDLQYRTSSVVPFIQSRSLNTHEQFQKVMTGTSDSSIVGVFVQITNERQEIIYQSDLLSSHRAPVMPAGPADGSLSVTTVGDRGWPLRVANQQARVNGVTLTVHVVEPLRDLLDSLREYSLYLAVLLPLALLLTTTAGYWLSRRALAPVEEIRQQAEAIDPADLTARLQVPPTDDELARLAQTLNAMLSRIEGGFRSIEQFTADASHELRAPLALIITAGEVSLRKQRTAEELAEVLRRVISEARHMSKLVENLLDLARGDARRRHSEPVPTNVVPMLRELCSELRPRAEAKSLHLTASLPEHEVWIPAESTQIRRLILILIDNAIKYTEAGSIHLSLVEENQQVVIKVEDTGIGIEQSAIPHVFDRFWRADKVRSRSEGGAGLGLSLASQIVQRHGGTIFVESNVDQGTAFTVKLDTAEARQIDNLSENMQVRGGA
jgi:heavy metal sensor kinase